MIRIHHIALVAALLSPIVANAETPDEWVTLGARVHGGFGAFIPLGIKIGLDAAQRLNAKPRELFVVYYDSGAVVCSLSLLIRWAQRARRQAETPLIALCRFPGPALTRDTDGYGGVGADTLNCSLEKASRFYDQKVSCGLTRASHTL